MNKKLVGGLIILLMLISSTSSIIELNSCQTTFEQTSSENPLKKIDSEILKSINSKGGIKNIPDSEIIKVIIILNENNSVIDMAIPSYVKILQQYSIINGFFAEVPLNKIVELSKIQQIKNIWVDRKIDSYLSADSKQFIQGFLSAASNPGDFINFTQMIGATDVWAKGYNGSGVVIAIMDAGVDITGQIGGDLDDFDENFNTTDSKFVGAVSLVPEEPLYYTDFMGRGTYHAGIACGTGYLSNSSDPTNRTYIGVAPGASYLNVKIYDSVGITYWSFMISGVEWAIQHNADILLFCTTILGLYLDPISMAITNAVKKGMVVVVPSGDDGPSYMSVTTPSSALGAICVGAYDPYTENVANFSSRGPGYDFRTTPDIIAPGVDLVGPRARIFTNDTLEYISMITDSLSENAGMIGELLGLDTSNLDQIMSFGFTLPENIIPRPNYGTPINENYTKSSGTGAAAAVVAGALALLIQAFPLANPELLRTAICKTAKPILNDQNSEGSGLINVSAAYDYLNNLLGQSNFRKIPYSVPLPYIGVISTSNSSNWDQTLLGQPLNMENINAYDMNTLFSTQGLMDATLITNGTSNETLDFIQIHMPLNQFGLFFNGRNHWFSEFQVVRELHQMTTINIGDEDYNRYIGVLELNGLYVIITVDTWNYIAQYIDISGNRVFVQYEDRVNGMKIGIRILNLRTDGQAIQDLQLISYFKADLFMNETGALNTENTDGLLNILDVGLDDNAYFDPSTQVMCVSDENNDTSYAYPYKFANMGFKSINKDVIGYRIDNSISLLGNLTAGGLLGMDPIPSNYFDNNSHYVLGMEDPGFAMIYNLSSNLAYKGWSNFSSVYTIGIGKSESLANATTYKMIDYVMKNVTNYEVKDILIVKASLDRMHFQDEVYSSDALILNVGNVDVNNTIIGFSSNRYNQNGEIETFSIIKPPINMKLDDILILNAKWTPQYEGIFLVGWVVISINSNMYMIYTEDNILNNIIFRNVYVVNRQRYVNILKTTFDVYPNKLDQNPWKIHYPLDFGFYNITTFNLIDINDVTVSVEGAGKNYMFLMWTGPDIYSLLNQTEESPDTSSLLTNLNTSIHTDVLKPYSMIFIMMYGPLLCPQGILRFNITFSSPTLGGVFYSLPVELEFKEYRGRVFFDGIHNFLTTATNISALLNGDLPSNVNLTNFIDLEERFDYPFANYNTLKNLWSNYNSKGVAIQTFLPGININITEIASGFMAIQDTNNSEPQEGSTLGIDLDVQIDPSMFAKMLGGFSFSGNNFTTNVITLDLLQFFDVLIICDPETGFNQSEIDDIVKWVKAGGSLIVWAENKTENQVNSINNLLVYFNMSISENSVGGGSLIDVTSSEWTNSGNIFPNYDIGTIRFRDPVSVNIFNDNKGIADAVELLCPYIGVATTGEGRVAVIGDKDVFTELGQSQENNTQFAEKLIQFALSSFFEITITPKKTDLELYRYNEFHAKIENYDTVAKIKEYVDNGVLFLVAFVYEDATIVNITVYGFQLPLFLMFKKSGGEFATSYYGQWYNKTGRYYAIFIIDDPAVAQEIFYVPFNVIYMEKPPDVHYYEFPTPAYPHWIDIIGIIWVVSMSILIWLYNTEKWKTRFKITQLKGSVLNQARTKMNEGETLFKQILKGLRITSDEQEQMRLIMSYRKRLSKYLKDLKKFGEDIGEHY